MKQKYLHNPPITETVIDFRVNHNTEISIDDLEKNISLPQDFCSEKQPIYFMQSSLKFGSSANSCSSENFVIGYKFDSNDKKRVVQFRMDGFTYSHLSLYPGWEIVSKEAKTLWEKYSNLMKPCEINRLAIRTINTPKIINTVT